MVKLTEYESYLKKLIPDLYRFSSVLIPDELQAQQIVIDSISSFSEDSKKMLGEFFLNDTNFPGDLSYIRICLMQKIFQLAKRRIIQLGKSVDFSFNYNPKFRPYYALELSSRAILFLSHVEKLNISSIEEIVELKSEEVLRGLEFGRSQLLTENSV